MTIANNNDELYSVVIPAAGQGRRFNAKIPKQYVCIDGKPILQHTVEFFLQSTAIDLIVVVLDANDQQWSQLPISQHERIITVTGGAQRAQSVLNGLDYLSTVQSLKRWVLVHDACRPFIRQQELQRLLNAVKQDAVGGLLATPATDTLKRVQNNRVQETIARDTVWQAQTPQMFRLGQLKEALIKALDMGYAVTDEASAMEFIGLQPLIVTGSVSNSKVTYEEDLKK